MVLPGFNTRRGLVLSQVLVRGVLSAYAVPGTDTVSAYAVSGTTAYALAVRGTDAVCAGYGPMRVLCNARY